MKNTLLAKTGRRTAIIALITGLAPSTSAFNVDRPNFEVPAMVIVWAYDDDNPENGIQVVDYLTLANDGSTTDLMPTVTGRTMTHGTLEPTADSMGGVTYPNDRVLLQDANGDPISIMNLTDGSTYSPFDVAGTRTQILRDAETSSFINYGSRIGIASNTGFQIQASVSNVFATGSFTTDMIQTRMRFHYSYPYTIASTVLGEHANATSLNSDPYNFQPLSYLDGRTVATVPHATAAADGTILQQSVLFTTNYSLSTQMNDQDLSLGSGEAGATITYTVYVL
ncbi:MAG: hypothetical protein AAGH49_04080 [Pseudomonadota bacterium]